MVSLGLWDNFVGTEAMQQQTTLHELGHNLGLWHGGAPAGVHAAFVRTCPATGQPELRSVLTWSVMNYINQATGVVDENSVAHTRLSGEQGPISTRLALADGRFRPEHLVVRTDGCTRVLEASGYCPPRDSKQTM